MGQVIAVVSGKGGTGKTSLVSHVGLALAAIAIMCYVLFVKKPTPEQLYVNRLKVGAEEKEEEQE